MKHTIEELHALQAESLDRKIRIAQTRIIEWYEKFNGNVYVAFSGGKDSTVLLDIVRSLYPEVEAVFIDTGLEYPEVVEFVKTIPNVTIIKPSITFPEVLKNHGYPIISKEVSETVSGTRRGVPSLSTKLYGKKLDKYGKKSRYNREKYLYLLDADFEISEKCCTVMKKKPSRVFEKETGKKPYVGTLADESLLRRNSWLKVGCNTFDKNREKSRPLSIWLEQDILQYLTITGLPYCSVYGDIVPKNDTELMTTGIERTGCMFCMFGAHLEKEPNRFHKMQDTHPQLYNYCLGGGEYSEDGKWIPNKKGLGMAHVLDFIKVNYKK